MDSSSGRVHDCVAWCHVHGCVAAAGRALPGKSNGAPKQKHHRISAASHDHITTANGKRTSLCVHAASVALAALDSSLGTGVACVVATRH